VWAAFLEYLHMMQEGRATLHDILLLFIYLELGAMARIDTVYPNLSQNTAISVLTLRQKDSGSRRYRACPNRAR